MEVWIFMGLEHETMTRWEGHDSCQECNCFLSIYISLSVLHVIAKRLAR